MLDFFLTYLLEYQYVVFFCVTVVAAFGLPIPATALIVAGGAFCAQGYFDIGYIFFAGLIGSITGDTIGYMLSYHYGEKIFRTIGLGKLLDSRQFTVLRPSFEKNALLTIFLSRFLITAIGPMVNILSGLMRIHPRIFVPIDIIGETLYIGLYMYIGYRLGTEWESIITLIESFSTLLLSFFGLITLGYILQKLSRRKGLKPTL